MREMSEMTGLPLRGGGLGRKQRHAITHSHLEWVQPPATLLPPTPPPSPTREDFERMVGKTSPLGLYGA